MRNTRPVLASVAGLALATALGACGADAGSSAATSEEQQTSAAASSAAGWLAGELKDGLLVTGYESPDGGWVKTPDVGLSLDAYLALDAGDHDADQEAILSAVEQDPTLYIGAEPAAYAGATGKLLTVVQEAGADASDFGGVDLVGRLEAQVSSQGSEAGRAKDAWDPKDKWGGDFSNTIGQSWVVRGLAAAGADSAPATVAFLLEQQCEEGYFRLGMESSDHTCDGGTAEESAPSVDATAFAVTALLAAEEDLGDEVDEDAVDDALDRASAWLLEAQEESGAFVEPDSGAENANTTGLAAWALDALGEEDAAEEAALWVADQQVSEEDGDLAAEAGAVAFDESALATAEQKGTIPRAARSQWLRATAQAAPALELVG